MKQIKIISKTKKGVLAIKKHIEETYKIKNYLNNVAFKKMGYRQELVLNEPVSLIIEINNPSYRTLIKQKHFCDEITDVMKENGAEINIDFYYEVE